MNSVAERMLPKRAATGFAHSFSPIVSLGVSYVPHGTTPAHGVKESKYPLEEMVCGSAGWENV